MRMRRRLAGAVAAEEHGDGVAPRRERHALEDVVLADVGVDVPELEERRVRAGRRRHGSPARRRRRSRRPGRPGHGSRAPAVSSAMRRAVLEDGDRVRERHHHVDLVLDEQDGPRPARAGSPRSAGRWPALPPAPSRRWARRAAGPRARARGGCPRRASACRRAAGSPAGAPRTWRRGGPCRGSRAPVLQLRIARRRRARPPGRGPRAPGRRGARSRARSASGRRWSAGTSARSRAASAPPGRAR